VLGVVLLVLSLVPRRTHGFAAAYIDPLSGSVLLQVLAAAVLGAMFTIKSLFARVQGFLRGMWLKILRR
jgi:hypothetical protein